VLPAPTGWTECPFRARQVLREWGCRVNFSDQPPSKQWSALKFRGETIAEVWFKPDDNPIALMFRIPQATFQIPGIDRRLTIENLLKAVGVAAGAWNPGGMSTRTGLE
jgi:hypothetical protein